MRRHASAPAGAHGQTTRAAARTIGLSIGIEDVDDLSGDRSVASELAMDGLRR